ncbi:MAG TPA: hypothetical protein VK489_10490 [Ferruginibacter sp.]|nr:hypothetical protein [Ferruginibacter sp.]
MKKILVVLVLVSTMEEAHAQGTMSDQVFSIPAGNFTRRFMISLDKAEKFQVELSRRETLSTLDIDSIVKIFMHDMEPLKDSFPAEIYSRRIDYLIDNESKKIRVQKAGAGASHFMLNKDGLSLLKLEQDTITITVKVIPVSDPAGSKRNQSYRLTFFLNDLNDLSNYAGHLNEKINVLENNLYSRWKLHKDGQWYMIKNPSITAPGPAGNISGADMLTLRLSVDVQNYKNYFVPSASFGFSIKTNKNSMRREYGLGAETHFRFAKNSDGKLKTFTNNFLTLSYGQARISNKPADLYPFISIGYLVNKKGNDYDKNTFKIGMGRFSFKGGSTRIEPAFYFNDFFKGITPSFRLSQSF